MIAVAFLAHFAWFLSGTSTWYVFWSGFGSCLTEFAIIGVVFRKINCHTRGCWRIGHHHIEGTPYTVCRRHHPDVPNRGLQP